MSTSLLESFTMNQCVVLFSFFTTNHYSRVSKWLANVECDFVNYETNPGYASRLRFTSVRVVNEKELERRAPKARESRRRMQGLGRGYPPPQWDGSGKGPPFQKFFLFLIGHIMFIKGFSIDTVSVYGFT